MQTRQDYQDFITKLWELGPAYKQAAEEALEDERKQRIFDAHVVRHNDLDGYNAEIDKILEGVV